MPNRILRDGILRSERVAKLAPTAELFFRRLMSVVDDFGRYYASEALLLSDCYPIRPEWADLEMISLALAECSEAGLLAIYEVNNTRFLEIHNFLQRIRPGRESKFPPLADFGRQVPHKSANGGSRATTPPTPPNSNCISSSKKENIEVSPSEVPDFLETGVQLARIEHPTPEEVFSEVEPLYVAGGVPTSSKHRDSVLRCVFDIPVERRGRIANYVKWAFVTGKWPSPSKTKGFRNLMLDGDWDVELTQRVLPDAIQRPPSRSEQATRSAADAFLASKGEAHR